ncbi:uncharacterized protein EKO05_0000561 [Ascochyta rabiei]|uniref:Uncharacterized protein n=1 Tax=Didymella rabiei TaxID=5454 RepID=A0A163HP68_DIDRA|nr:uncharacterized protein EKO05_0000561 [Ascochyta rabiei]KZM25389.1 hypothetical protein ST47_g3484 [Ascochyta rabiei]UPX09881.1 hypothetical protein EKO05_0000561 [Ascochyta rabiei]
MARRHGYNRSSTCFRPSIYDDYALSDYACLVVFLAVYLGTLITLCIVRRGTGAGKHLIGLPYMLALSFKFIQQAINFVSSTLQACEVTYGSTDVYSWIIAINVFYGLETIMLLFVVLWTLNTMLRKQLGHNPSALRMGLIAVLTILGILNAVSVILYSYTSWLSRDYRNLVDFNYTAVYYVDLAFWSVYLASILASATLSLLAVRSPKTKRVAGGLLVLWASILYLSLFVYSLIPVIRSSVLFIPQGQISRAGYLAMYWISSLFHALVFISIIGIAKDGTWRPNTFAATGAPVEREHDAYDHQQDPVYDGAGQRA